MTDARSQNERRTGHARLTHDIDDRGMATSRVVLSSLLEETANAIAAHRQLHRIQAPLRLYSAVLELFQTPIGSHSSVVDCFSNDSLKPG